MNMQWDGSWLRHGAVSRTGAEVEPGLSRPEQKRRRVTRGRRWASVEIPVVKQIMHVSPGGAATPGTLRHSLSRSGR